MDNLKVLVLSNFFFCHYVFKKPSTAEVSESVYMRKRVNPFPHTTNQQQTKWKSSINEYFILKKNFKAELITLWKKREISHR